MPVITGSTNPKHFGHIREEFPLNVIFLFIFFIVLEALKMAADRLGKTTVVNIRKFNLNKMGFKDLEDWLRDPNHVYIGRDMAHYARGATGSKWGNPFTAKMYDGREERVRMYKEYVKTNQEIRENGRTLYESLEELRGKVLGCWCHPERCHGHALVELLEERKVK